MKNRTLRQLSDFCKNNRLIVIAFALTTLWFIIQHATGLSWDFSVYVLNARYFWGDSLYFDWGASPFAAVLLAAAGAGPVAEYAYIVFVSLLWLFACMRLADAWGIDRTIFYVICLNPAVLILGLRNGTELLALAFLALFLSEYFAGKGRGAFALGLSAISRWTYFVFLPLIFLSKNVRKIAIGVLLAAVAILPWFAYTWIATGGPLIGMAEATTAELVRQESFVQSFSLMDLLLIGNWMLPLAAVGFVLCKRKWKEVVMLIVLVLGMLVYARTAIKDVRYMFTIILPLAYFSAMALKQLKISRKMITALIAVNIAATLVVAAIVPLYVFLEGRQQFASALEDRDSCAMSSNAWVFMNYVGWPAERPVPEKLVDKKISEGWRLLMFKNTRSPDWFNNETFRNSLPVIVERPEYWIFGRPELCAEPVSLATTYTDRLNELRVAMGKTPLSRCELIFGGWCRNPAVKVLFGY